MRLSNDGLQEEIRLRLESIGKTEIQIAKEQELKKYREEMARKGIEQENPEYGRGLSLIDEKYKNEESLRKNWEAGVKQDLQISNNKRLMLMAMSPMLPGLPLKE